MRGALILNGVVDNVIEYDDGFVVAPPYELHALADDQFVGPGWNLAGDVFTPAPILTIPTPPDPMDVVTAELIAQRKILDLLLLGGLEDGGTIDGEIGAELPDLGGSLDDLEGLDGLDWTALPDSGETLDDLEGLH